MLNLVVLFSVLLSFSSWGSSDKAVYRIKGITYFQSDIDKLTSTYIQTKRCLKKKMTLEGFLGLSNFSTIQDKKNRQSLLLSKIIQYASFTGSKERDDKLKSKYKSCLNDKNYHLLSAEYFLRNNKNHGFVKSEMNRSLTHYFYNKTPTEKLWQKK